MQAIPLYPKVMTLGASGTDGALTGLVRIQEKVDGSQFRFGVNEDGGLIFGSHRQPIDPVYNAPAMFKPAMNYLVSVKDMLVALGRDTYYFAETLQKPKHNHLQYSRIPTNHIVLFDIMQDGRWLSHDELMRYATAIGVDFIPQLYDGQADTALIKSLSEHESYLGGAKAEGVVIKNYEKMIMLGGQVWPLFTKYVRPEFKESHTKAIAAEKAAIPDYINGFKSEARWRKAVQHLRESGALTDSPKDIGPLVKEIQKDISEEEAENIKHFLYRYYIKDIMYRATSGFPEWYKEQLLGNVHVG